MLTLRTLFAAEGARTKEYKPWRPEGLPAKVVAVANFKGGSSTARRVDDDFRDAAVQDRVALVAEEAVSTLNVQKSGIRLEGVKADELARA